jgi:hypothetical protein
MPAPSRVLRRLRTLLDTRDGRDLGEVFGCADGGADDEDDDDSGGNADDETSDVLCVLCAFSDGCANELRTTVSVESDYDENTADDDAWLSAPWRVAPVAVACVATELAPEQQRCVSAPEAAGTPCIVQRLDGLGLDTDVDTPSVGTPRRWKSELVVRGRYATGGSDGDCESVGE